MLRGSNVQHITKRTMTAIVFLTLAALLAACGTGGSMLGTVKNDGKLTINVISSHDQQLITDAEVKASIGGTPIGNASLNGTIILNNVPTGIRSLEISSGDQYEKKTINVHVTSTMQTIEVELERKPDPDPVVNINGVANQPDFNFNAVLPDTAWQQFVAVLSGPAAHAQAVSGEVPFANAFVRASTYDVDSGGREFLDSTTANGDGQFSLTLTSPQIDDIVGIAVLIEVFEQESSEEDTPILYYIIRETTEEDMEITVDTVSTLVAELFIAKFDWGTAIDEGEWDQVNQAVEDLVADAGRETFDLRTGHGWISTAQNLILQRISLDLISATDGFPRAQRIVSVLRNTWPSLIASAGPFIGGATDALEDMVGPVFNTVNERVAIIGSLVSGADFEWDSLVEGHPFVFPDAEGKYELRTDVVTVDDEDEDIKIVETQFTVVRLGEGDDEEELAFGLMNFELEKEQPVDWIDLNVTFVHEDEGGESVTELSLAAYIEFTWREDPDHGESFGDTRLLEKIVINTTDLGGENGEGNTLMTASGTLTAEMDDREWTDSGNQLFSMPTLLTFHGEIHLPDQNATLDVENLKFTLDEEGDDRHSYRLEVTLSLNIGAENDEDLIVSGTFEAEGIHLSSDEDQDSHGETTSEFDGSVQVRDRESVELKLKTTRNALDGFEVSDVTIVSERLTLTGTIDVEDVDAGDKLGTFDRAKVTFNLEDDDSAYKLVDVEVTISGLISGGLEVMISGHLVDDNENVLARFENDPALGPIIVYDPDTEPGQYDGKYFETLM